VPNPLAAIGAYGLAALKAILAADSDLDLARGKACRNGRRNLTFDDDTQAGGALHADQAVTKLSKRRCPSVIANFSILQL
jgi:hypothetical protein